MREQTPSTSGVTELSGFIGLPFFTHVIYIHPC